MARYSFLLLAFLMLACKGPKPSRPAGKSSRKIVLQQNDAHADFYKRYSGRVGGKPVVVQLHSWGGSLEGSFQYNSIGQVIELRPTAEAATEDDIHLMEWHAEANGMNEQPSRWVIRLNENYISGERRSADGLSVDSIKLTEDYPSGSIRLNALFVADSASLEPVNEEAPKATSTYQVLLPQEDTSGFLYKTIRNQILMHNRPESDITAAIAGENRSYFEDYQKVNKEIYYEFASSGSPAFLFNYTNELTLTVLYNDDNWLVTQRFFSAYTGGAHDNYALSFSNTDLAQKKVWELNDIVANPRMLRPLLDEAAREYFGLNEEDDLLTRLLVDEVPATTNVFITGKGLTFVYNPYEIASFADGQISLFIPYARLMRVLTPAFRSRMHLSGNTGVAIL